MGKPKRLYDNFIDPDVRRINDMIKLARNSGFIKDQDAECAVEAFSSVCVARGSKVVKNAAIFDDFYKEVVTCVSDYPYLSFIKAANVAYNEAYAYVLQEATPNQNMVPEWVDDIFTDVEWTPVDSYIGRIPIHNYDDLVYDRKANLASVVNYTIKTGGMIHQVSGAVITYIAASVMRKVSSDLKLALEANALDTFTNVPVHVLGDSVTRMSATILTKKDLDFAILALRVLASYGVDVNISQLIRLASIVTVASVGEIEAYEYEQEEERELQIVGRNDDLYDDNEEE